MTMTRKKIEIYAKKIASRFDVEKIILFGSHALGSPTKDSDVDLLVVMKHSDRAAKQAAKIRQEVPFEGALDLLVRSPDEIKKRLRWNDGFLKEIIDEGVLVYEPHH